MTNRKPLLVDQFIEGIDPAKRIRHRGILRTLQYHKNSSLNDLAGYVQYARKEHPNGVGTPPAIGQLEADGFYYFYADEFSSQADSMQEAATILKRNRSTLNGYCKDKTFPFSKSIDGKKTVDIIAAQDWILFNTDHHADLEPYWPEVTNNCLVAMHIDEQFKPEPLFHVFSGQTEAA